MNRIESVAAANNGIKIIAIGNSGADKVFGEEVGVALLGDVEDGSDVEVPEGEVGVDVGALEGEGEGVDELEPTVMSPLIALLLIGLPI